jgi:hypothetical protein
VAFVVSSWVLLLVAAMLVGVVLGSLVALLPQPIQALNL